MTPLESVRAISEAKFGGAAAAVVLFHTLILWRMCNYTVARGWCGFSRDQKRKKSLMNMSMRYCLKSPIHRCEWEPGESFLSEGRRQPEMERTWPWPTFSWNQGQNDSWTQQTTRRHIEYQLDATVFHLSVSCCLTGCRLFLVPGLTFT